jgi:hypothetical protein
MDNTIIEILSDDTIVKECLNLITINIYKNNYKDYEKIKKISLYKEPLDYIFIWKSYKNINYGIFLEKFTMDDITNDVCEYSSFYGRVKSFKRLSNTEYLKYTRISKINKILDT